MKNTNNIASPTDKHNTEKKKNLHKTFKNFKKSFTMSRKCNIMLVKKFLFNGKYGETPISVVIEKRLFM